MDRGPFRAGRSTERKPAPTYRQPEEAQVPAEPQAKPVVREAAPHRAAQQDNKSSKRLILPIVAIVVVAMLAIGGWFAWSKMHTTIATSIDTSKYQAVFFTNGQVYFGKLKGLSADSLKLTDVFYLQGQQTDTKSGDSNNPQDSAADSNVQLIKLGNEVHGPEDEMVIAQNQMLFYENLKPDGKVAQSIAKYKESNK